MEILQAYQHSVLVSCSSQVGAVAVAAAAVAAAAATCEVVSRAVARVVVVVSSSRAAQLCHCSTLSLELTPHETTSRVLFLVSLTRISSRKTTTFNSDRDRLKSVFRTSVTSTRMLVSRSVWPS